MEEIQNSSFQKNFLDLAHKLCLSTCAELIRAQPQILNSSEGVKNHRLRLNILKFSLANNLLKKSDETFKPAFLLMDQPGKAETILSHLSLIQSDPSTFLWLGRCLDHMGDVLWGRKNAEEVLFPMNDFALVERIYNESRLFSFYSKKCAELVNSLSANKKLTVLELGAGTGSTTKNILDKNPLGFKEYYFTDYGKVFLNMALKKWGQHPFMKFELSDINSLTYPENKFDLIHMVNVLHLANHPEITLKILFKSLSKDGHFILGEFSSPSNDPGFTLFDFTFGLLPSFYSQERNCGLLYDIETWKKFLANAGFKDIEFFPSDVSNPLGGVYLCKK